MATYIICLLVALAACCVAIPPNNQTSPPSGESSHQLVVEDSDETDMDDDDGDGDLFQRVRQSVEETLCIVRTLEAIDEEHHRSWNNVRACLERFTTLLSNPNRNREEVENCFATFTNTVDQLPANLARTFETTFNRVLPPPVRAQHQQPQQPQPQQQPQQEPQQQPQQQESSPSTSGLHLPRQYPPARVLPVWMRRQPPSMSEPSTSRQGDEQPESSPILRRALMGEGSQRREEPTPVRPRPLRCSCRQDQQHQPQHRLLEEDEEEDVFAFPPQQTPRHNNQPHGDQRTFWGLCGHCCGILQHSGGYTMHDYQMSRRVMDRVDEIIRTQHQQPDNWTDRRGADVLRRWMRMVRNVLSFISYFLARTNTVQQGALAAAVWRELHASISSVLQADNHLMRTYAADSGSPLYNIQDHTRPCSPEPPGQPPECSICMDVRPSVVLIPCGHLFCGPCMDGVGRCPTCRTLFHAKYNIFF